MSGPTIASNLLVSKELVLVLMIDTTLTQIAVESHWAMNILIVNTFFGKTNPCDKKSRKMNIDLFTLVSLVQLKSQKSGLN